MTSTARSIKPSSRSTPNETAIRGTTSTWLLRIKRRLTGFGRARHQAHSDGGPVAGTMDQVRPHMREQRFADCASLAWPTGPHPTLSGSGPAPTADRSKTPVAGLVREG